MKMFVSFYIYVINSLKFLQWFKYFQGLLHVIYPLNFDTGRNFFKTELQMF
jgi:hypothetical protein